MWKVNILDLVRKSYMSFYCAKDKLYGTRWGQYGGSPSIFIPYWIAVFFVEFVRCIDALSKIKVTLSSIAGQFEFIYVLRRNKNIPISIVVIVSSMRSHIQFQFESNPNIIDVWPCAFILIIPLLLFLGSQE